MDGQILRDHRERYGLTQAEVARAAGMRQPDLSAIEHGRRGGAELHRRVQVAIRQLVRPSAVLADEEIRRELRESLLRHGARDIRVFGSTARGVDRPGSDLDIMAKFPPGFDLFDLMEVEAELEGLLGIRVDVVSDDDRTPYALADAKADAVRL
ncbi:MAG TPA: nucleotidyltransferase domain-containing protein [Nakamurella sp.]